MKLIEKGVKLFNKGYPTHFGYQYSLNLDYNIKEARIPLFKLKEWDFFQITSENFSLYLVLGHVSYATSINVTLFDFKTKKLYSKAKLVPFKQIKLDSNPNKDFLVSYTSKDYQMSFNRINNTYYLIMNSLDNVSANIKLVDRGNNSVLVSTPFNKRNEFYLNEKKCLLESSGYVDFNGQRYDIKKGESFGLLDWGRGVFPFKHTWVWGSGSGYVDNIPFGFNIGEFGDNRNGTENIFFYNNKSYKLNKINIKFDESDYMDEWSYESDDGSFMFKMIPTYDNHTKTKLLWVDNECHQIFGYFNGYIVVDGKKIEIKDFYAFTECAHNRW